jgi:hypothetical protein
MTWRAYRKEFMTVYPQWERGNNPDRETAVTMHVPDLEGALRQWLVDDGHSKETVNGTNFGFHMDGDNVHAWKLFKCFKELREKQRETWCQEARDTCHRVERKLYEIFELLDETTDAKEKLEGDAVLLKSSLTEAKRVAKSAEESAAEMKRRAKDSDPDRIRREVEAENAARVAQLEQSNRALASKLAESESQISKLAEDKKRLRAALNGARASR